MLSFAGCEKNFGDKNMTPELKLILGDWYCEAVLVNNIDSTTQLRDSVRMWQFYYEPKNAVSHMLFMRGIGRGLKEFEFKFIDDRKKMTYYNDIIKTKQIPDNRWVYRELTTWQIKELSKSKLKLISEPIQSNVYEIHFYKN